MSDTSSARTVSADAMQQVYEQTKTPFKYGIVLPAPEHGYVDCPSIFRHDNRWYMAYVETINKVGYETCLAVSDDLIHWTPTGKILPFAPDGWDRWQADGGFALVDHQWGGPCTLHPYRNRYWMTYLGGALQGYETDPLAIGVAWSEHPTRPAPWSRLPQNPVLSPSQSDVRPFEKRTLYKSSVIWDRAKALGSEFVMYYNGKQEGPGTERIGMALSDDMVSWRRFGNGPVIDNGPRGISGDPQIVKINDLWVMFYFGHVWKPKAFDTFACSYDMMNWTTWDGPHLIEPSEAWDATFAHKPWMIHWEGITYHFYCAVGNQGRAIALATSQPVG